MKQKELPQSKKQLEHLLSHTHEAIEFWGGAQSNFKDALKQVLEDYSPPERMGNPIPIFRNCRVFEYLDQKFVLKFCFDVQEPQKFSKDPKLLRQFIESGLRLDDAISMLARHLLELEDRIDHAIAECEETGIADSAEREETVVLPNDSGGNDAPTEYSIALAATVEQMKMVMGEIGGRAFAIAVNEKLNLDDRMSQLVALDPRYLGCNSPKWAKILQASSGAVIRNTVTWKLLMLNKKNPEKLRLLFQRKYPDL